MDEQQATKQKNSPMKKIIWGLLGLLLIGGLALIGLAPLQQNKPDQSETTKPKIYKPPASVSKPPTPTMVQPAPDPMASPVIPPRPVPTHTVKPSSKTKTRMPASTIDDMNSFSAAAGAAMAVAPEAEAMLEPNIVYNPPSEMTLGKAELVGVRITNKAITLEALTEDFVGDGEIQTDNIKTGGYMEVDLCCGDSANGDPFHIKAINPIRQIVTVGDFTEWAFRVTPLQAGEQTLTLSVRIIEYDQFGNERYTAGPVKLESLDVKVDHALQLQKFVQGNWQWLGLLLILPLMAWYLVRNIKNTKRKSRSGKESVFISYRRDDSSGYTLAIYQKLKDALGDDNVFMDRDDIPHGADFPSHLETVLNNASTVIVMIGERWLSAQNEQGRRLDNPNDFVRIEIATALERNITVIPVLLNNAQMPEAHELPEVLQPLSKRNAIRIYDDQFEGSIERLVDSIV